MNRVGFERLQSYPYPFPRLFASNRSPTQNLVYNYPSCPTKGCDDETFAGEDDNYHTIELEMLDKNGKKRGFISQALDDAKLKLSKLLSSNYTALIFFQMPSLYMYFPELFPFKRNTCIHFHL